MLHEHYLINNTIADECMLLNVWPKAIIELD